MGEQQDNSSIRKGLKKGTWNTTKRKKMLESLVKQNKHFGNAILALRP